MRAALIRETGGPGVVRIEEVDAPEPGAGEVRIRVAAVGLNHLDLWARRGVPRAPDLPHVGGSDVAGTVESLGAGVDDEWLGRRVVVNPTLWCGACEWCRRGEHPLCVRFGVFGEHTWGGAAELAVAPATNLYTLPDDVPFERAAAAPLVFATAWRGLVTRGRLRAGEDVLITGASGGVATAAVQIARLAGAHVRAVTTGANLERVRRLGAHVVYDREAADFSARVWHDTGKRGVDLILDSVGSAFWQPNVRALARGGRLVVYGATTGAEGPTDLRRLFWKQHEILGTTMSTVAEFESVMHLVFEGRLAPVIDVTWPLERAAEAHARLEAGEQFGNIVLLP